MILVAWVHRLFDHSDKTFVPALNLVALLGIRRDGLNYPLGFRFWEKAETKKSQRSKHELAIDLLQDLRKVVGKLRLWIAMDSWYPAANLLQAIEELGFVGWPGPSRPNDSSVAPLPKGAPV